MTPEANSPSGLRTPKSVVASFILFMISALGELAGMSFDLTPGGAFDYLGFAISLLFTVGTIVVAVFFLRGASWARIALLVLTILGVGFLGGFPVISAGAFGAGILAIVFSFVPASNKYFRGR